MLRFLNSIDLLLPYYISAPLMAAKGVPFAKEKIKGAKGEGEQKDETKKVKRRRGQQLVIAGLQLTLSFYKEL